MTERAAAPVVVGTIPETHRVEGRRGLLIVLLLALATEAAAFEIVLVGPALADIGAEFGVRRASWVLVVVFVVGAGTVPVLGKLGDLVGKRRVLRAVFVLLAGGSVVAATTGGFAGLLAGRALQATVTGSAVLCVGLARDLLPTRWVPVAVGAVFGGAGLGAIVGPVVSGVLVDQLGWRAVFWFLAGYAVLVLVALAAVPETPVRAEPHLDVAGAALLSGGVLALVLALETGGPRAPLLLAAAGAALLALRRHERRTTSPLLAPLLTPDPAVRHVLAAAAGGGAFQAGVALVLPLLMRTPPSGGTGGFAFSAVETGVRMGLPLGVGNVTGAVLGGLFSRRLSPRTALLLALACQLAGSGLLAVAALGVARESVSLGCLFVGLGIGGFLAASANLLVDALPSDRHGVGAGLKYTVEAIAGAVLIAAVTAVLGRATTAATEPGQALPTSWFVVALGLCATASLTGAAVAVRMRHGRRPAAGGLGEESR